MERFQPIVMPCIKKQYESLVPILKKHNIDCGYFLDTSICITNNHNGYNRYVCGNKFPLDSIHHASHDRKIYKRHNRKAFLASLGIIEESKSVTNKQYKMISKVEEIKQKPEPFKVGSLVKYGNNICIITNSTSNNTLFTIVSLHSQHGLTFNGIPDNQLTLFKGKLTLEQ